MTDYGSRYLSPMIPAPCAELVGNGAEVVGLFVLEVGIEGIDMYKFLLNGIGDLGVWRKRYTFVEEKSIHQNMKKLFLLLLMSATFLCMAAQKKEVVIQ